MCVCVCVCACVCACACACACVTLGLGKSPPCSHVLVTEVKGADLASEELIQRLMHAHLMRSSTVASTPMRRRGCGSAGVRSGGVSLIPFFAQGRGPRGGSSVGRSRVSCKSTDLGAGWVVNACCFVALFILLLYVWHVALCVACCFLPLLLAWSPALCACSHAFLLRFLLPRPRRMG